MQFIAVLGFNCDGEGTLSPAMEDLYLSLIKEASGNKFQNLKSAAQCAYGKRRRRRKKKKKNTLVDKGEGHLLSPEADSLVLLCPISENFCPP